MRVSSRVNPRIKSLTEAFKLNPHDMRTLTRRLDFRFRTNERRLFATEGSSGGRRWTPLSPRYRKRKEKTHPGRKILTRSGRTRRAFTHKGGSHVATYTLKPKAVVTLGAQSRIAAYHAPGSLHNPRLPVRDPIQMTNRQERGLVQAVRDYLAEEKLARVKRALLAGAAELRRRGVSGR